MDDVSNVEDIAAVLESKKDGTQIGIVVEVNVSILGVGIEFLRNFQFICLQKCRGRVFDLHKFV